ncbi:MAG: hypothetical protein ACK4WJ_05750 [Endomicrobiia bacterium]
MKIKNFKLTLRIKEVYNNLKQKNIKFTEEIETLVSVVEKELQEVISPSVVFDTFDVKKDERMKNFVNFLQIPKNVDSVSFIILTLGEKIESFVSSINDEMKKIVTETIIAEYLTSCSIFVTKILQEKFEDSLEMGSLFLLPENFYKEIINLLSADKIGVSYIEETRKLLPKYTSLNYLFWFRKK